MFIRWFHYGYGVYSFYIVPETDEQKAKRLLIETALANENTTLQQWQSLAISDHGLVNGK